MSWFVTETKYGTVVPAATGPLVCGVNVKVDGCEMHESAITSSLLTGLVDTHTSSMTPLKLCDCVVAPMRMGAKTLRTLAPPNTWPNCSPLMNRKRNRPSYMPATCVQALAWMGARETKVLP